MQSIDSIGTLENGTKKKSSMQKRRNYMWQYNKTTRKLFTLIILQRRHKKQNTNWPEILDHPYRILIVGGSGSVKTKCLA